MLQNNYPQATPASPKSPVFGVLNSIESVIGELFSKLCPILQDTTNTGKEEESDKTELMVRLDDIDQKLKKLLDSIVL